MEFSSRDPRLKMIVSLRQNVLECWMLTAVVLRSDAELIFPLSSWQTQKQLFFFPSQKLKPDRRSGVLFFFPHLELCLSQTKMSGHKTLWQTEFRKKNIQLSKSLNSWLLAKIGGKEKNTQNSEQTSYINCWINGTNKHSFLRSLRKLIPVMEAVHQNTKGLVRPDPPRLLSFLSIRPPGSFKVKYRRVLLKIYL